MLLLLCLQGGTKTRLDTCSSNTIPASTVEQYVVKQISGIGRDPQLIAETVHQMQEKSRKRLQELTSEERRLQRESQKCHAQMSSIVAGSLSGKSFSETTRWLAMLQERLTVIETRWKVYQAEAEIYERH